MDYVCSAEQHMPCLEVFDSFVEKFKILISLKVLSDNMNYTRKLLAFLATRRYLSRSFLIEPYLAY